jgi:hypothetical protein
MPADDGPREEGSLGKEEVESVGVKRVLTAVCLATGLLVSPVGTRHDGLGLLDVGAGSLAAKECRLEVELCQEIDLVFYKTRACWKVKLFCD